MLQIAPNIVANKVANKNGLWYNVYGSIWIWQDDQLAASFGNTQNMRYPIYSVTKSIVSIAVGIPKDTFPHPPAFKAGMTGEVEAQENWTGRLSALPAADCPHWFTERTG